MQTAAARIVRTGAEDAATAILLGQTGLLCDWTGCLYWSDERLLIVSDLHLEMGSSFARRGRFVPPYDTMTTLSALAQRVAFWQPRGVIALGDSFHDGEASERLRPEAIASLSAMMDAREWLWISGNHDPDPPVGVGGDCCKELALGPLVFRHEPSPGSTGEVCGHLHPHARIHRRGKSVRRRCFAHDGNRLIMPAFGAYTGGLNIRDAAFDGLFDEATLQACLLGRDRVYTIAGENLI